MSTPEGNHFEVYYALGTSPVLIGAASYEDLERICKEASAIASVGDAPRGAITGPASRHFFRELGRSAGVEQITVAAFEHYEDIVGASREAFLDHLASDDSDQSNQ